MHAKEVDLITINNKLRTKNKEQHYLTKIYLNIPREIVALNKRSSMTIEPLNHYPISKITKVISRIN